MTSNEMTTPATPATGTRRLIVTEGDGQPVYRKARRHDAVAAVHLIPADTGHSGQAGPGVRLVVHPSGRWVAQALPTGTLGATLLIASGNLTPDGVTIDADEADALADQARAEYESGVVKDPADLGWLAGFVAALDYVTSGETSDEIDALRDRLARVHASEHDHSREAATVAVRFEYAGGVRVYAVPREKFRDGMAEAEAEAVADAPTFEAAYVWNDHTNDIGDACPWSGEPIGADADPDLDVAACPARCRRSEVEPAEVKAADGPLALDQLRGIARSMIDCRVRGGFRADDSVALLADLTARHTGDNLAAALVFQGFADERLAERYAEAVGG